jgi:hypothetical protein
MANGLGALDQHFFSKKKKRWGLRCFPLLSTSFQPQNEKNMAAVQIWEPLERHPKAHRALPANAPIPAK